MTAVYTDPIHIIGMRLVFVQVSQRTFGTACVTVVMCGICGCITVVYAAITAFTSGQITVGGFRHTVSIGKKDIAVISLPVTRSDFMHGILPGKNHRSFCGNRYG
jgi:hypothetical protein